MRHTLAICLACTLLALVPALATAHAPGGIRAEFTPAPASASYAEVMAECVQDTEPANVHRHSGLGDERFPLVTLGPDTRQVSDFYSQGFVLQYGFNFPAAIQAFNKALSYDGGAAMPYWGMALSANSNINSNATHGCNRLSYRASQVALVNARARQDDPAARERYSPEQLAREVAYAEAFASLFEPAGSKVVVTDATQRRYVDSMKALAERFDQDLDAATLYADALLNVTPWQWWQGNAATSDDVRPTPEASAALQVLNKILMQNARHSGANHFFIHVIEESPFSESGKDMAERLPRLVPASGHLVHMAAHIWQRIGDNASASAANHTAIAVDRAFTNQNKANDVYPLHYLGHNIHFLAWTLSIEGRRNEALNTASELVQNTAVYASNAYLCRQFPEEIQVKSDYFFAVPFHYAVRFAAWDFLDRMAAAVEQANNGINQVCRAARPDWPTLEKPYTRAMLAYANAYRALSGPAPTPDAALAALREYWTTVRTVLERHPKLQYGANDASALFRIANVILLNLALGNGQRSPLIGLDTLQRELRASVGSGVAAALRHDLDAAGGDAGDAVQQLWQKGVEVQDGLNYNEPPDWYYTLREAQGYALLAQRKYDLAERVFTADLKNNRNSGRSLHGLQVSLEMQRKPVPQWLQEQFAVAWRNATVSAAPAP